MTFVKIAKRLFTLVVLLLVLAVLLTAALLFYVKPDKTLDLSYRPIDIRDKIEQMIRNRQLSFTLSEEEVNSLFKRAISEHPLPLPPDIRIEGADVRLAEGGLVADFNLRYKERIPIAATVYLRAEWRSPELVVELERIKAKQLTLPQAVVEGCQYRFRLDEHLPSFIRITDIGIQPGGVRIDWEVDQDRVEELLEDFLRHRGY